MEGADRGEMDLPPRPQRADIGKRRQDAHLAGEDVAIGEMFDRVHVLGVDRGVFRAQRFPRLRLFSLHVRGEVVLPCQRSDGVHRLHLADGRDVADDRARKPDQE